MVWIEEVAERFGIGCAEPSTGKSKIEELMCTPSFMDAIIFPPFESAVESIVRVGVGCEGHEFVADVGEIDSFDSHMNVLGIYCLHDASMMPTRKTRFLASDIPL